MIISFSDLTTACAPLPSSSVQEQISQWIKENILEINYLCLLGKENSVSAQDFKKSLLIQINKAIEAFACCHPNFSDKICSEITIDKSTIDEIELCCKLFLFLYKAAPYMIVDYFKNNHRVNKNFFIENTFLFLVLNIPFTREIDLTPYKESLNLVNELYTDPAFDFTNVFHHPAIAALFENFDSEIKGVPFLFLNSAPPIIRFNHSEIARFINDFPFYSSLQIRVDEPCLAPAYFIEFLSTRDYNLKLNLRIYNTNLDLSSILSHFNESFTPFIQNCLNCPLIFNSQYLFNLFFDHYKKISKFTFEEFLKIKSFRFIYYWLKHLSTEAPMIELRKDGVTNPKEIFDCFLTSLDTPYPLSLECLKNEFVLEFIYQDFLNYKVTFLRALSQSHQIKIYDFLEFIEKTFWFVDAFQLDHPFRNFLKRWKEIKNASDNLEPFKLELCEAPVSGSSIEMIELKKWLESIKLQDLSVRRTSTIKKMEEYLALLVTTPLGNQNFLIAGLSSLNQVSNQEWLTHLDFLELFVSLAPLRFQELILFDKSHYYFKNLILTLLMSENSLEFFVQAGGINERFKYHRLLIEVFTILFQRHLFFDFTLLMPNFSNSWHHLLKKTCFELTGFRNFCKDIVQHKKKTVPATVFASLSNFHPYYMLALLNNNSFYINLSSEEEMALIHEIYTMLAEIKPADCKDFQNYLMELTGSCQFYRTIIQLLQKIDPHRFDMFNRINLDVIEIQKEKIFELLQQPESEMDFPILTNLNTLETLYQLTQEELEPLISFSKNSNALYKIKKYIIPLFPQPLLNFIEKPFILFLFHLCFKNAFLHFPLKDVVALSSLIPEKHFFWTSYPQLATLTKLEPKRLYHFLNKDPQMALSLGSTEGRFFCLDELIQNPQNVFYFDFLNSQGEGAFVATFDLNQIQLKTLLRSQTNYLITLFLQNIRQWINPLDLLEKLKDYWNEIGHAQKDYAVRLMIYIFYSHNYPEGGWPGGWTKEQLSNIFFLFIRIYCVKFDEFYTYAENYIKNSISSLIENEK